MSTWRKIFGPPWKETKQAITDHVRGCREEDAKIMANARLDVDDLDSFNFTDTDLLRKCYKELRLIRAYLELRG